MIWLIILAVIVTVFLVGHYGLPEKINPLDYQSDPHPSRIMKGAEPFRLEGDSDVAFLLVHGFEGSPFTLRGLGELLHERGHTVIAPLLPGHGTSIKNFAETRYEHWYQKVHSIYIKERPKFRKFFVVGFSMGGNLSLRLVTNFASRMPVTGLILISAPVFLNGFFNGSLSIKSYKLFFSGIIKNFVKYIPKRKEFLASDVMSPWVGYSEAYTIPCVHSFKKNLGKVRPRLKLVRAPACLIQATNDRTISSENMHYIMRKISSRERRAFLFSIDETVSTRHVLITHHEIRNRVYHYILEFIEDTLKDFDLKPGIVSKPEPSWLSRLFGIGEV